MDLDEYFAIPDGIEAVDVARHIDLFLAEAPFDPLDVSLQKLEILADHQWHTYQRPSLDVERKVEGWLLANWAECQSYYELVLKVVYCFGLQKALYERALSKYEGEFMVEFKENLKRSSGSTINPYWSLG